MLFSLIRVGGHDAYFIIGENIGTRDCPIPTAGIQWQHIRLPVVLEQWPVCPEGATDRFTTVASWRGAFGPVYYGDKVYGLKVHEFRKLIELPQRSPYTFEIALHPPRPRCAGNSPRRILIRIRCWAGC